MVNRDQCLIRSVSFNFQFNEGKITNISSIHYMNVIINIYIMCIKYLTLSLIQSKSLKFNSRPPPARPKKGKCGHFSSSPLPLLILNHYHFLFGLLQYFSESFSCSEFSPLYCPDLHSILHKLIP